MRSIALGGLLFALVLSLPTLAAGAPFERDGTIGAGAFFATAERRFSFSAVAGEPIVATLTWADPSARLFLDANIPGSACSLLTPTAPSCIASGLLQHEVCSTTSTGAGVYESPQRLALTAPVDGTYRLSVLTFASTTIAAYSLTVAIGDGGAGRVATGGSFFPSSVDGDAAVCAALAST